MSRSYKILAKVPIGDGWDRYWEVTMRGGHYKVRKIILTSDGYYAMPNLRVNKADINRVIRGEIPYPYSFKDQMTKVKE